MDFLDIYTDLINICNQNVACISEIQKWNASHAPIYDDLKELIVKQAYMQVYTKWESFLENSFIFYSLGYENMAGFKTMRYVLPRDYEHAYSIITGDKPYPDWTTVKNVIKLSENLFESGEPFKDILQKANSQFDEMKKVRNHISHCSRKSSLDFESLVRTTLSPSMVGVSVGEFLLSKKRKSSITIYRNYFNYIQNSAKLICTYQVE